jgi:hypothetical protein
MMRDKRLQASAASRGLELHAQEVVEERLQRQVPRSNQRQQPDLELSTEDHHPR